MKTKLAGIAAAGVLCAVLATGMACADTQQVAREYAADVALDIGVDGQVTAVALPVDVPAMLVGPAQNAMKRWRFKSPVRDGHAVTARTYARTRLQLVQQPDGNYGLRVMFRSNGPKLTYGQPPRYPLDEIRHRNEGRLIMEAVAQPDGRLTDVHMIKHRFSDTHFSAFQQSVMTALAHCRVTPEWVDGKPVATRIQIPFVFELNYVSRAEALSRQVRPQADRAATGDGGSSAPADEVVALDSPVQPLEGNPHS